MKSISVLGGGMVGKHIAAELSKTYDVACFDMVEVTPPGYGKAQFCTTGFPITAENVGSLIETSDLVVNALPGHVGYEVAKAIILAGKDLVDISFMPEDPSDLKELAQKHKVTAIFDFGLAPGLCGMWAGEAYKDLNGLKTLIIEVGGNPTNPKAPYFYKAPFSPVDVLEEYTRPVRYREYGEDKVAEPFSQITPFMDHFASSYITPYAFNSDGLRTLLTSFPDVPNMIERTIRDFRHIDLMLHLKRAGFFAPEHLENTAKVMLPYFKFEPGEADFTVMRVVCESHLDCTHEYYLSDVRKNDIPSMSRTTGYACAAAVEFLINENLEKTLYLPENLGQIPAFVQFVENYLRDREVFIQKKEITQEW